MKIYDCVVIKLHKFLVCRKCAVGAKSKCEQPVEASSDTCTMEQAKQLDTACGMQLARDCAEAAMPFFKRSGSYCPALA